MIEFSNPNFSLNMSALLQGMWYSELPELVDIEIICENLKDVLYKMQQGQYNYYELEQDGFIKDFKGINSPSYLRKPGVEAITYYVFKKNKTLREMQMVNLIHYCAFIYNSLYVFEDIFAQLYINEDNLKYIENSNSYVVVNESFWVGTPYDCEEVEEGVFTNENNKVTRWMKIEDAKKRIQSCQKSKLYFIKMDIESFFPNLYTHYLARIGKSEPYKRLGFSQRYYDFLDKFHQRINDNQTKGVPAGNFSSHIGAELLMLCVDYDIREMIGQKKIGYIRYVDDMTFYSDNQQELEDMVMQVQKILTKYRLRINGNKVERGKTTRSKGFYISKKEVCEKFIYLDDDCHETIELNYDHFFDLKNYISDLLDKERIGQVKTILTRFLKKLELGKIQFIEEDSWFYYFQALVFDEESLAYNIYKILNMILKNSQSKEILLQELKGKREFVDNHYSDTLIQIWHYYVMTQNMDESDKTQLFQTYIRDIEFTDSNPIIISHFINRGEKKNKDIWRYIRDGYKNQTKETDWKSKILFSKWWLPIFKIKMVDNYNYDRFLTSSLFPKVLTDLSLSREDAE
ncbi:reverse transcriptase domain-containing protein [Blautia sp. HCN-1074]|jgi:hypothetical protein|uniref:reverse transcriptase domain-containing protein n=1 Tax=Blautia sp. HCN-1074 TaxID=3134667 RepID=UPI000E489E3E|nr:hypothetical protein DW776_10870 [Ruminococcus sp. AM30-15AC]